MMEFFAASFKDFPILATPSLSYPVACAIQYCSTFTTSLGIWDFTDYGKLLSNDTIGLDTKEIFRSGLHSVPLVSNRMPHSLQHKFL